ncbi:MAG: efflux RND transporter periplasmic adaptor subunit [Planctomycetota bacterium]
MPVEQEKPPPIRSDLEIYPQYYRGELRYVLKDPVGQDFYRLGEAEYLVIKCFQQGMGVERTQQEIKEQMGVELPTTEIYKFAHQLRGSNMLKSKGMEDVRELSRHAEKLRKQKIKSVLSNYLFITIPMWDPDDLLEKFLPVFRFFMRPIFFLMWLIFAGIATWIIATNFSTLVANAFTLLSGWNLLILSGVVFSVKVFHELGHAFTCKHFGGEVHAIGPAFLVFQPAMYTDATDAWQFPSKWARMGVTAAGLIAELFMASVAAIVWLTSEPGFLKQLSYTTMVVCTVHSIMFNGNPLLRFDGYYVLTDLVEIPNLRQKATQYLGYLFDRYFLGVQEEHGPPVKEKDVHTLVIYGILRGIYRIFIILSIGFFLYSLFEPLGIFMWVSSAYGMIVMPVYQHGRDLARKYRAGSVKIRYMLILLLAISAVAGLFFMPIPYSVEAPCVVSPADMSVLRAPTEARVTEVLVSEGEQVRADQPLVQLKSNELETAIKRIRHQIAEMQVRMRQALENEPTEHAIHRQEKKQLEEELKDLEEKRERLTLRAPVDGVVMNATRLEMRPGQRRQEFVEFPGKDAARELDLIEGMQVNPGTGLVAVGDTSSVRIEAYIFEYDLPRVAPGEPLEYLLRNYPTDPIESEVDNIRAVDVQSIDNIGLTLEDIGSIPVQPTREGKREPLVTLYRLRGRLEKNERQLPVGATGKSKITYGEGPAGIYYFNQIVRALRMRMQRI